MSNKAWALTTSTTETTTHYKLARINIEAARGDEYAEEIPGYIELFFACHCTTSDGLKEIPNRGVYHKIEGAAFTSFVGQSLTGVSTLPDFEGLFYNYAYSLGLFGAGSIVELGS